jgi:FAD dependent oxidoreductase TIGR03364
MPLKHVWTSATGRLTPTRAAGDSQAVTLPLRSVRADLAVIGAGIVGLAHAVDAVRRGLSVVVMERDDRAVGASVRNFGHGCITAQEGEALGYALAARELWIGLAKHAGFWLGETGTVVVARADDELAVLEELAVTRDGHVVLLDAHGVAARVGDMPGTVGGAWLPLDLRVDPRSVAAALAAWLVEQGVVFQWSTTAHVIEPGLVATSRGEVHADRIVVAIGHDIDRHYPDLAARKAIRRCSLHMLRVATPSGRAIEPAVFTGSSLLRYPAFRSCPSTGHVRARLAEACPELLAADVNLMLTQSADGDLFIGDTHAYASTPAPFRPEDLDRLLLDQVAQLFGVSALRVRERWRGVYASAPQDEFLIATTAPGIRAVSITTGIGMTTALGLAPRVLDELFT